VHPETLSKTTHPDKEGAPNAEGVAVRPRNEGVAATAVGPTPAAAESTRDAAPATVEPTQPASPDARGNAPAAAKEAHASAAASTAAEPTPAAPAPHEQVIRPASHQHHKAVGHAPASRPSTPPADANARVVASSVNTVAQRHAKLCMDPNGLVRKGRFGDMDLFDRMLEEQVGFADVNPLRGLYAEHCISTDSHAAFSPPNNPGLVCTPEGEFFFVVGKDGVDKAMWELKPAARCKRKMGSDPVVVRRGDVLVVKEDAATVEASFFDSDLDWDEDRLDLQQHAWCCKWKSSALAATGVVLQVDELSVLLEHEDGQTRWWPYGAVLMEQSKPLNWDCMVAGRNAKTVAELLERPEAKRARLRDAEIIALRLYSGPMYAVYNPILRPGEDAAGSASTKNLYPTTMQLIVSGICKLSRVAEAPAELCVYRGLSGMVLPKKFFDADQQGFAGGVEASFMSTTLDEQVTSRAHCFATEIHVYRSLDMQMHMLVCTCSCTCLSGHI